MDKLRLADELKRDEGLRLKPYHCSEGKLTIGIGRNLEDVGITKDEALYLFGNDINRVVQEIEDVLPWFSSLSDARQRALCNLAFQMGIVGLLKFKRMLAAMKVGDFAAAANEARDSLWYRQTPERAKRVIALIREG
jgi:lysozyme